ncbi:Orf128 [Heliothis zea nudivirus]|uniref:Orf128 n=1 Tax=Heliothis zea nudivirus 1 TaxID=3116536 RepID=Q8JKI5_9VIRU|nr:Orf128 [Heliothis zea nudivirus]AAN04421.1 Orf128 [Heliothis zea nudivirus]
MIQKLTRTARIITLKLRRKRVTPEVEKESKITQRNNQYQIMARNIIYFLIYQTTYGTHPKVVIASKRTHYYGANSEYDTDMIMNLDKYMKHFISLVYEKFAEQLRKSYTDKDKSKAEQQQQQQQQAQAEIQGQVETDQIIQAQPAYIQNHKQDSDDEDDDEDDEDGYNSDASCINDYDAYSRVCNHVKKLLDNGVGNANSCVSASNGNIEDSESRDGCMDEDGEDRVDGDSDEDISNVPKEFNIPKESKEPKDASKDSTKEYSNDNDDSNSVVNDHISVGASASTSTSASASIVASNGDAESVYSTGGTRYLTTDSNKRLKLNSSIEDDDDDEELAGNYSVSGSVSTLKPINLAMYSEAKSKYNETIQNDNIIKKLYLSLLMELNQSKLLSFLLEKIENKRYAQRAVMEVLRESSRKLSRKGVAFAQRIQYLDYIENLLKQQCYKDVADKLHTLALDLEYNCFRYTDVVNPNDDCLPIDLKHFDTLARFTKTVYGYSTHTPLNLTTESHTLDGKIYDIVKFTRDGESEIFDVRAVNQVQLDFKSWKDRLNCLPTDQLPQSYIKIIPHKINKINIWSGKLKEEADKTYLYVRTSGLGRGTLFMNIGKSAEKRRNKTFPVLNTRHKKLKKDHLYDGDVVETKINKDAEKIIMAPMENCKIASTVKSDIAFDVSRLMGSVMTADSSIYSERGEDEEDAE